MSQPAREERYEDSYNRFLNSGYVQGSAAPARTGRPERADRTTRQTTPQKTSTRTAQKNNRVTRPVRRAESVYSIEITQVKKNVLIRIMALAVIFLGAFICVASVAYTDSRKIVLEAMDKQLNDLRVDNIILRGEILDSYDLTDIERYAYGVLGMVKPDDSQIVYVDEVKVSYVVHHDVEETEVSPMRIFRDLMSAIISLIKTGK